MTDVFKPVLWHNPRSRLPRQGMKVTWLSKRPGQHDGQFNGIHLWVDDDEKHVDTTADVIQWRERQ